jgi:hypothetical protein
MVTHSSSRHLHLTCCPSPAAAHTHVTRSRPPPLLLLTPASRHAPVAAAAAAAAAAVDLQALEGSSAALIPLKSQSSAEDLVESHIPRSKWDALLAHQREGVLAGVRRGGRLLLADDMGLGKSAQVSGF